ncbi:hypothetical protein [Spiroplasma endosymbiont of Asaphidion curtum]
MRFFAILFTCTYKYNSAYLNLILNKYFMLSIIANYKLKQLN